MGPNSSSAAMRSEAAFGSLASMGARKLKKKPVLVVDPDELAQAHHLFQIGAAEQLDEFEPQQRPRANVSLFGLAPMAEGNDNAMFAQPPSPLNDDHEELEDEGPEAEAPAPEQVLALTRPHDPKAPRANIFGALPDAPKQRSSEPTPVREDPHIHAARTPEPIAQKAPPLVSTSEPTAARPRLVRNYDDVAPGLSNREPVRSAPLPPSPPEPASEPTQASPPKPRSANLPPARVATPQASHGSDLDDGVASVIMFEEEEAQRPAPKPPAPPPSEQSRLRARIVREDVCLTQPEPSRWQLFVALLRRWYAALTGR